VRAAASRLGGKVSLASTLGAGTIVRLTLPLTLVLTRLMVVACAGERYGIPLDAVTETVRLPRDRIVAIRAGRAFVLRDRPVPLLSLAELLHLPEQPAEATELRAVVIRIGTDIIALAVDRLVGRIEALTRPMAGLLAGMPGVVGTTLMGDGGVMMVLDVAELVG
jgi:two-component system chemotaxis sensor kinase CheA